MFATALDNLGNKTARNKLLNMGIPQEVLEGLTDETCASMLRLNERHSRALEDWISERPVTVLQGTERMSELLQAKNDNLSAEGADAVRSTMEDLLKAVTKLSFFEPQASFWTQIQGTPYSISTKLGGGSSAFVYVGRGAGSDELLAIKLEKQDKKRSGGVTLWSEYFNYRTLRDLPECKRQGFCSAVRKAHNDEYKVLIMELLGSSLEELLLQCGGKMSLPTVLRLAEQMIHRLETLHSTHKVHGNVKPENFVIGRSGEQSDVVYCIDLRDCVTYGRKGAHVPFFGGWGNVKGNLTFMCIDGHMNVRKSRRSDIESLAYTLIYLLQGSLPWSDLSRWPKRSHEVKRLDMKISYGRRTKSKTTGDEEVPGEFFDLLEYAQKLGYTDEPDYEQLRSSFRSLAERKGIAADAKWDWEDKTGVSVVRKELS